MLSRQHLEAQCSERVGRQLDRLAGHAARFLAEHHVERGLAVEARIERDPALDDEAVGGAGDRLEDFDRRCRDTFDQVDLPHQTARRAECACTPRGGRIAVDGEMGRIAGGECHPVAVVARTDVGDVTGMDRNRLARVSGLVVLGPEDVELLVAGVVIERHRPVHGLECAEVRADGRPVTCLTAVGVGDDPPGLRPQHRRIELAARLQIVERRSEQHRAIRVEQPGPGQIDDAFCTARHHRW